MRGSSGSYLILATSSSGLGYLEWYTDGVAVLLGADSVVVVACISAVAAVCGVAVLVESTSNGVVAALCVVGVIASPVELGGGDLGSYFIKSLWLLIEP